MKKKFQPSIWMDLAGDLAVPDSVAAALAFSWLKPQLS